MPVACVLSAPLCALLFPLLVLALPSPAAGEEIDDYCHMEWWSGEWNMVHLGPAGQEFVAARDRLNFVDLWLSEGASNSDGVELAVRVRTVDLGGAVLATSRSVLLPNSAEGYFRFRFGPAVPLVPGAGYFLELFRPQGEGYAMVRGRFEDICPGGRAWLQGAPAPTIDLWYQLGWDPAAVATGGRSWGMWKAGR